MAKHCPTCTCAEQEARTATRQENIAVIQKGNELIADIYYAASAQLVREFARMLRGGQ